MHSMGKSCSSVYHWYRKFSEGCKKVLNLPHAHVLPKAVCDMNIHHTEEMNLGNRWITVHDIASGSGVSVRSVETVIHEHLLFKKVCTWCVTKMLTLDKKVHHVVSALLPWKAEVVQHEMDSHRVCTTKEIQDKERSWQVCFGIQEEWFMLIFFHMG
jgi:hypothetical protein